MKLLPDARMVDIRIVEVPYQWRGMVPEREVTNVDNSRFIQLAHEPSGTQYTVEVETSVSEANEVARLRAEAKLAFIKALHGDA